MAGAKAEAVKTAAERDADLLWAVCPACQRERHLDGPIDGPGGALFLPHARFVPVEHPRPNELPEYREQCPGSLAPATPVAPIFSDIDTGAG